MAITENGSFTRLSQSLGGPAPYTTSNVTPIAVGDALVATGRIRISGAGSIDSVTVSGSMCTGWTQLAYFHANLAGNETGVYVWIGTVASLSAAAITVSASVSSGITVAGEVTVQEFTNGSSSNNWTNDGTGAVSSNGSSTTVAYPSLTPIRNGELYFAYAWVNSTTAVAGSSPNCTYFITAIADATTWDATTSAGVALSGITCTQSPSADISYVVAGLAQPSAGPPLGPPLVYGQSVKRASYY